MTNIIKYNTAGCSLIRKHVGLSAQNFVKEGLKGIKFPAGAVSYDVAKIGRKFNANEFFTDIFTFKDENGKILQRLTKEVNGAETKQTLKWYKYLFECDSENDENILLNGRKTSGYERINGRISRIWDEVITKTNTNTKETHNTINLQQTVQNNVTTALNNQQLFKQPETDEILIEDDLSKTQILDI